MKKPAKKATKPVAKKKVSPKKKVIKKVLKPQEPKDITKLVTDFESACKILKRNPRVIPGVSKLPKKYRSFIVGSYKLVTVIEALNEGFDPIKEGYGYYNWFYIDKSKKGASAFVFYYTLCDSADTLTGGGSRLYFKTRELAQYAGNNPKIKALYYDVSVMGANL